MNKEPKQKWIDEGGTLFFPISAGIKIHLTPGPGVWQAYQKPDPTDRRIGLKYLGPKFEFPFKLYDTGGSKIIDRVKRMWNSEKYEETGKNLGVILNGTKGTGKTICAKLLCNDLDMPTIIVNDSFEGGILEFIQSIEFECIVLIDEAEKTFTKDDDEILLKLIDGVYNASRKLYVLTTNRLTVNENLIGRPGRIRYIQEFGNLPPKTVEAYISDNLEDQSKKMQILQEVDMLEISTIDILKALVEEVNILGDLEEGNPMNVPRAKYIYDVLELEGCGVDDIPLIMKILSENKPDDLDIYSWVSSGKRVVKALEEASMSPVSSKEQDKSEASESSNEKEYDSPVDFIEDQIPSCCEAWVSRMTTSHSILWKDTDTSLGTIVKDPDENGFFLLKSRWGEEDVLCLVLRKRGNPSLYKGLLF